MTKTIKIIRLNSGAAVKFPFDLKDKFRRIFPSAKWNSGEKQWEVGSRSVVRLEQWAEAFEVLANKIAEIDAVALDDAELEKLNSYTAREETRLEEILAQKASAEERRAEIQTAREGLKELEEKIAKASEEKAAANKIVKDQIKQMHKQVSGIIDINEVDALRAEMISAMKSGTAAGNRKFEAAWDRLNDLRNELLEFGIDCEQMTDALNANKYRPDRDLEKLYGDLIFYAYAE